MKSFNGRLAVVTGAGTGMGRELAIKLAADGCHVAMCDILLDNLEETETAARESAVKGALVSAHGCDVSDEKQVLDFCRAVKENHKNESINLLFNNAGAGGGASFVLSPREEWDRVFAIDWFGVYYCTRAFMPMLLAADEAHIINVSSINGFWACLGPDIPHTAYSSAKFAVKGFTEALVVDLKLNAPHVKVSLVMPGHIGTSIGLNAPRILGHIESNAWELNTEEIARMRATLAEEGAPVGDLSDEEMKAALLAPGEAFRDDAPMTAAEAADVILEGVRREEWRILVGQDADALDRLVREDPEDAYSEAFVVRLLKAAEEAGADVAEQLAAFLQRNT